MARRSGDTGNEPKRGRRPDAHRKAKAAEGSPSGGRGRVVAFETELETYRGHLTELLGSEGKFVLILGKVVDGAFDTYGDALEAGYTRADNDQVAYAARDWNHPAASSGVTSWSAEPMAA